MKRDQIGLWVVYLAIFLLPWQTRWIFKDVTLSGEIFEYGRLSIYFVEGLICLAAMLLQRFQVLYRREVGMLVMLFGVVFISVTFSLFSSIGYAQIFHLIVAGFLFMIVLDERVKVRSVATAFVFGLIGPSLLGWYQLVVGSSSASTFFGLAEHTAIEQGTSVVELASGQRIMRAYGSFPHPNIFGGYLAVGFLAINWLIIKFPNIPSWRRIILSAVGVLIGTTLIATFSRGAWIALLVGGIIILWLAIISKIKFSKQYKIFVMSLLIGVIGMVGVLHQPISARLNPALRLESKSINERQLSYVDFIEVAKLNPFTGIGIGGYTVALALLNEDLPVWSYQPVHNSFLLLFAEIGLLGFLVCFFWVKRIVEQIYKERKIIGGIFSFGMISTLAVIGIFDHYLWSLWAGLALVLLAFGLTLRIVRS